MAMRTMSRISFYLAAFVVAAALPCLAATFPVTTTNDSGSGSLRAAITSANGGSGTNTITFNIPPTNDTVTVRTITPASALPAISRPVIIDGYTQPGTSSNTLANADNAKLLIEITGANPNFEAG